MGKLVFSGDAPSLPCFSRARILHNMTDNLDSIEAWIGRPIPEQYRAFLAANVDDQFVGDRVLLYGRSSFIERNETYETRSYCPGFVNIGDDSGGTQVLLNLTDGRLLLVDAGDMTPESAVLIADCFTNWLESGCPLTAKEPTP